LDGISASLSSDLRALSSDYIISSVSSTIQTDIYSDYSDFIVNAVSSEVYELYGEAISGQVVEEILSVSSSITSDVVNSVSSNI